MVFSLFVLFGFYGSSPTQIVDKFKKLCFKKSLNFLNMFKNEDS